MIAHKLTLATPPEIILDQPLEDMLLADSGENDPEIITIFATKKNLEILCNSDCVYLDGTFKSCPDLLAELQNWNKAE